MSAYKVEHKWPDPPPKVQPANAVALSGTKNVIVLSLGYAVPPVGPREQEGDSLSVDVQGARRFMIPLDSAKELLTGLERVIRRSEEL